MTEIIEKTKELGALLQNSDQVRRFIAAKSAYEQDEDVQKLVKEFNMHKVTVSSLSRTEGGDQARIEEAEARMKAAYDAVMNHEKMKDYQTASTALQEVLNQVNGIIQYYVTGEAPASCTHNCATCGGCH